MREIMKNRILIWLFQAVQPMEYMGIAVKNYVQPTAETMSVTYRRERVLDVNQDGRAQIVWHVWFQLQIISMLLLANVPWHPVWCFYECIPYEKSF